LLVAANLALQTDQACRKSWQASDDGKKYGIIAPPPRISIDVCPKRFIIKQNGELMPFLFLFLEVEPKAPKASEPVIPLASSASASNSKSKPASKPTASSTKPSSSSAGKSNGAQQDKKLKKEPSKQSLKRKSSSLGNASANENKGKAGDDKVAEAQRRDLEALLMDVDFSGRFFCFFGPRELTLQCVLIIVFVCLLLEDAPSSSAPPQGDSQTAPTSSSASLAVAGPTESQQQVEKPSRRRVRKTRTVQRKKTETDAKGYRRASEALSLLSSFQNCCVLTSLSPLFVGTVTVEEEESYSESEEDKPEPAKPEKDKKPAASSSRSKPEGSAARRKSAGAPGAQRSLNAFFKKG
jgi:hypothetical protein